jgi:thiosulfate/3-mercaptopyruvate sulfurtransferase
MSEPAIVKYVDIQWLKSNLNGPFRILDFQPDVHDYIKEHIPGAIYMSERHFRAFHHNQPAVYVSPSIIESLLCQAGVNNSMPVVIYSGRGRFSQQGDGLDQTMAAYTLARFGHREIYILNGGIDAWIEAGWELEKQYTSIEQNSFIVNTQDNLFVNYHQFKERMHSPDTIMIDVRPRSVYEGQSLWSKPGHIPGAVNLPWRQFMTHTNACMLRPQHQIQELIDSKGIKQFQNILLYCGTGREATAAFIVFKYVMNYTNVNLYEGSFTEWCTNAENETVTGPNPF